MRHIHVLFYKLKLILITPGLTKMYTIYWDMIAQYRMSSAEFMFVDGVFFLYIVRWVFPIFVGNTREITIATNLYLARCHQAEQKPWQGTKREN